MSASGLEELASRIEKLVAEGGSLKALILLKQMIETAPESPLTQRAIDLLYPKLQKKTAPLAAVAVKKSAKPVRGSDVVEIPVAADADIERAFADQFRPNAMVEPERYGFGSVPLFFFVAHLWLYAAIGRFFPAGTTLPRMYVFWLLGLVLLYWPCRWYGEFKRRLPPGSIYRTL